MFAHPAWLPAGLAACLCLLWLWRRYDARQHAALARFVSSHLRAQLTQSVSVGRRRTQRALTLAALAMLFVALAGPLVGYRWEQISRRGIELIFAVDTSRSMSTPDVKPDRLTRAKLAIEDFTNELDGDAVGLVAFAGDAFLVCPITLDYGAFHESLNSVDINTIPRGGTNIASAIREAGHKNVHYFRSMQEGIEYLLKQARPGDAVLTIGAGNISRASNEFMVLLGTEHPTHHAHS